MLGRVMIIVFRIMRKRCFLHSFSVNSRFFGMFMKLKMTQDERQIKYALIAKR